MTEYLEETKVLVREAVIRNDITGMVLTGLAALMLLTVTVLAIMEHRAKMKAMRMRERDFREWQETKIAQNDVEVDAFGNVFYRLN